MTLTATPLSGSVLTALDGLLPTGQAVLSGWTFSAPGYTAGDPVYLSLGVGYSRDALDVWSYNGSTWSAFAANDLTFDGRFASFTVTALDGYDYAVAAVPVLPGDANGDGFVDVNDLTTVLTNYGKTGMTWSQGDFTGDGTVDVNDLTIVLSNFGQTAGAGIESVPEPAATTLLATGAAGLLAWEFRRRRGAGQRPLG